MGVGVPRPEIGSLTLLVYRECPCGNWLATGEGAVAPICPDCSGPFVPGGGPVETEGKGPMFGTSTTESRALRGLGFAAFLTGEMGAVHLIRRVHDWLGLAGYVRGRAGGSKGEHYTDNERQWAADEITGAAGSEP